jgi:hypothetical protein
VLLLSILEGQRKQKALRTLKYLALSVFQSSNCYIAATNATSYGNTGLDDIVASPFPSPQNRNVRIWSTRGHRGRRLPNRSRVPAAPSYIRLAELVTCQQSTYQDRLCTSGCAPLQFIKCHSKTRTLYSRLGQTSSFFPVRLLFTCRSREVFEGGEREVPA